MAKKQQKIKSTKVYNKHFREELKKLNPAQRKAVQHIEGPVLVIAGPGTGKTHILTARIGRILMETDAQAFNLLCLTFTDAGVHAMRARLLEFIGPESHRVHIYTFHSFCNSIIQDNLELFGRHDLEPLSELEKVELIRGIIDDLEIGHPLRSSSTYFYERHLQDLFSRMKSENWSVDFIHQKIDSYLADLPNRKEFIYQRKSGTNKKGDLKTVKLEDVTTRMERLRSAVNLFPKYLQLMRKIRRYDFDDMILWVLKAFEENPSLLRSYQEQYLYFLVDEYQDTNGAQNNILQQLIHYWPNPNVFIVGDDDQSIFEFQGARLKNLEDFYYDYKNDLELVVLKNNYRSSQSILNSSHALINRNEKRIISSLKELSIEKNLLAKNKDFAKSKLLPQIIEYQNKAQEEADIVYQIEQLYEAGFPLNEVAVIYAKHRQAQNVISLLEKKDIPYNSKRRINILDDPLIQNIRSFLIYFNLEFQKPNSGEHLLFKILHFEFLNIDPNDINLLSIYMAKQAWDKKPKWRNLLQNKKLLQKIGLTNLEAILRFSDLVNGLLQEYTSLSTPSFLERLLNRSGLLQFVIHHENKIWLLQILSSLLEFVKKETDRKPRLSIKKLLITFDNMDANRISIDVNRSIFSEQGVNLLTAHGSKGLEFQQVFLLGCIKDNWEPKGRTSNYRFPFPDTLTFSNEEDAMEARRRLFYVAMTRAKERLYISYPKEKNTGKTIQRSIFVDELLSETNMELNQKELAPTVIYESQLLMLTEQQKPKIAAPDKDTLDGLLEGFILSVSSMNSYLRCPLGFYYEYVLRVPTLNSEAAAYGTAMHNSLQRLFERMMLSKEKTFLVKEQFIQLFEYEMKRQQSYFSIKEFDRRMQIGKKNLALYYEANIKTWRKEVKLEFDVRNVEIDGVPIKGVIDKIEYLGNDQVRIVDYKTGSRSGSKLSKPTEKNPYGGTYWRQLVCYKILFENHKDTSQRVKTAEISYLQADSKSKFVTKEITFKAADIALVKELITNSFQNIQQHNFFEGCGEPKCKWCEFVKHNVAFDSLADLEIEELDD